MLPEKYKPRNSSGIIGNKKQMHEIRQWLARWRKGRGLILHGPPGVGKSIAMRLLAEEAGYEVIESGADEQDKDFVDALLSAAKQRSVFGKKKLLLIEGDANRRNIGRLIKECDAPVVVVVENAYETPLRSYCAAIRFSALRSDMLENFLRAICEKEGMRYDSTGIARLAKDGDLRAALMDLEAAGSALIDDVAAMQRETERGVLETLEAMTKAQSLEAALSALRKSEKAPEDIFAWLCENAYLSNNPDVYDTLSRADIAAARIMRRQSWSLQKQFVALIAVAAMSMQTKELMARPRYRKAAESELAGMLHISAKKMHGYSSVIHMLAKKKVFREKYGIEN